MQMLAIKDQERRKEALRGLKEQLLKRAQEHIGLLESACIEELTDREIHENLQTLAGFLLIRRLVETDRIRLPLDLNRYSLLPDAGELHSLINHGMIGTKPYAASEKAKEEAEERQTRREGNDGNNRRDRRRPAKQARYLGPRKNYREGGL
jgi:hypothetical protein